jgi:hypothetical protein
MRGPTLTSKLAGMSAARRRRIAQRTQQLIAVEQAISSRRNHGRPRRLSLSDIAACHVYEWLVFYWAGDPRFGGCPLCQQLGARLSRFIGASEARRLRKVARVRAATTKVFQQRRRLMQRLAR